MSLCRGVTMQNFNPPTREDLNAYIVLIRFLRQVHSLMQEINVEAERFTELLKEQKDLLEEQDWALQDLSSSVEDYEEEIRRQAGMYKKEIAAIQRQEELRNHLGRAHV